jgi:ABC-2 type transport system ATP-binding protein
VERFSGGMRRRVELAKGLLHRPRVLLLDEPSTGLDPSARIELWRQVRQIADGGVTVLVTTHLMEEADLCSRLAIMRLGRILACDTPANLKGRIGGDVITLASADPHAVREAIAQQLGVESEVVGGSVRLERPRGHELVPQLIEAAPGLVDSVSVGKPTLQDVFIRLTGQAGLDEVNEPPAPVAHAAR